MASESAVVVKEEMDHVIKEENVDVEKKDGILGEKANESEVVGDEIVVNEAPKVSVVKTESSGNVSKSKASSQSKVSTATSSKASRQNKDQASSRGPAALARAKRTTSSLTQSLSFPAKGVNSDVMRKSIDVYPKKLNAKGSLPNSTAKPVSHSSAAGRRVSGVLKSANINVGGTTSRRKTLPAASSLHQSVVYIAFSSYPFAIPFLFLHHLL